MSKFLFPLVKPFLDESDVVAVEVLIFQRNFLKIGHENVALALQFEVKQGIRQREQPFPKLLLILLVQIVVDQIAYFRQLSSEFQRCEAFVHSDGEEEGPVFLNQFFFEAEDTNGVILQHQFQVKH